MKAGEIGAFRQILMDGADRSIDDWQGLSAGQDNAAVSGSFDFKRIALYFDTL